LEKIILGFKFPLKGRPEGFFKGKGGLNYFGGFYSQKLGWLAIFLIGGDCPFRNSKKVPQKGFLDLF